MSAAAKPTRRYRHWTTGLKAAFLAELGRLGTVTAAAEAIGVCRTHAYELRRSDPDFAEAFAEALEEAADRLEEEARRRAVEGTEVPVIHGGKPAVAGDGQPLTIRRYSDALLLALLKARRPVPFRDAPPPDSSDTGDSHGGLLENTPTARERLARALEEAVAASPADPVPPA